MRPCQTIAAANTDSTAFKKWRANVTGRLLLLAPRERHALPDDHWVVREGVVAPSLTPESYNQFLAKEFRTFGCSSLSHPGKLQSPW